MFGKLIGIVYGLIFVLALAQCIHFYNTVNYQADIARGYIEGVLSTNNINDMKNYLQQGLDQLNRYNYHGSPVLWPTPYQNFDLVKADLQKQINGLNEYQKTYNTTSDKSYAYQQTISNAQNKAETVDSRIAEINSLRGLNPYENPMWVVFVLIALIAWLPITIATEWWENRERRLENERWRAKHGSSDGTYRSPSMF